MGKLTSSLALCLVLLANALWAGEPDEAGAEGDTAENTLKKKATSAPDGDSYEKFRFDRYGEVVASFKDHDVNHFFGGNKGSSNDHCNTIIIPRFVLTLDYKFNSKWILGAEIEFESGGADTTVELESSKDGEYGTEIKKGGKVALGRFHITRLIHPAFNVRAGHSIVPVGLTNAHHKPVNFFGIYRSEGGTTILPSAWHETGIEFFGSFNRGCATFDYQALVVVELNTSGSDRNNWVAGGKQGFFEVNNFTSPAYIAHLDYRGVSSLHIGDPFYCCVNTAFNSDRTAAYAGVKAPLYIYTVDDQHKNKYVTARTNFVFGNLTGVIAINSKNKGSSNSSPCTRVVRVAKGTVSYASEVSISLRSIYNDSKKVPVIYPFTRYGYYNPQGEGEKDQLPVDKRSQASMWTAGLNQYVLPNLAVEAGYMVRQTGTDKVFDRGRYNSEDELSIGIAYVGWFIKK